MSTRPIDTCPVCGATVALRLGGRFVKHGFQHMNRSADGGRQGRSRGCDGTGFTRAELLRSNRGRTA